MDDLNFNIYQSPFSWRYGSGKMRKIFSEVNRRKIWRKVWVSLAKAQFRAGLITKTEFEDIEKNAQKINIKKSLEIEKVIYHDLMAEVKTFAKNAKVGGGKIHLGATSTDITDNTDIYLSKEALLTIEEKLKETLKSFSNKIAKYKNLVCMAYTHLQPAEPTTLGYRMAIYAQDLLMDLKLLKYLSESLKTKGIKGAVGTSAAYERLLQGTKYDSFWLENEAMSNLDLSPSVVTGQTYSRKTDLLITFVLTSIAQSIHKFCFDLRIMQSPAFGEWSEPRDVNRVGSSAMPFKRNPDKAEKICSLARFIQSSGNLAFHNAANNLLERTLDDSANRRIFLPEAFLATDEILIETNKIVDDLVIYKKNIQNNLDKFAPFAATEVVMMEAVKAGANRQEIHEIVRQLSMMAWREINKNEPNPLVNLLKKDKILIKFIPPARIEKLINPKSHTGLAQKRCGLLLKQIRRLYPELIEGD